jgi:hypothetical protein
VVSVKEKVLLGQDQVSIQEMNESEPLLKVSKSGQMLSKRVSLSVTGINLEETFLPSRRQPAYRWHELDTGSYMELGNLSPRR